MRTDQSLARRAAVAMALTVGFYTLAIGLGLGTIAFPFILAYITGQLIVKLVIICLITGVTILGAMIPKTDEFRPPGPLLMPEDHPRLFELIQRVASATEQEMPRHVYLVPDFNAWVAQRGGKGGFGGNRIMGIGLPLISSMNVSQFTAIIAHEFGHYHHGDTRLGPRIYQTRAAIIRTVTDLHERGSILKAPFKWYGLMYLRITHAISRSQEFSADRLAVQIAGKAAMTSALSDLTSKAVAYDMYWNQEFTPVLNRHRIPPLLEGYQLFLKSDDARKRVEEIAQLQLEEEKTDKYDTHPSMKARLEAIAELEETNASVDNTSALSLLDDPEKQERTLLKALIKDSEYSKMSPIAWNAEVNELFIANWEETTVQIGKVLKPMTPPDLPAFVKDPLSFVEDQASVKGMDDQVAPQVINNLIYGVSTGLALLLCRQGFRMEMSVGSEPKMMRDGVELQPLSVIGRLVSKQLSQDEWLEQCRELGIYDQSLFVEAKTAEKQEDLHQSQ